MELVPLRRRFDRLGSGESIGRVALVVVGADRAVNLAVLRPEHHAAGAFGALVFRKHFHLFPVFRVIGDQLRPGVADSEIEPSGVIRRDGPVILRPALLAQRAEVPEPAGFRVESDQPAVRVGDRPDRAVVGLRHRHAHSPVRRKHPELLCGRIEFRQAAAVKAVVAVAAAVKRRKHRIGSIRRERQREELLFPRRRSNRINAVGAAVIGEDAHQHIVAVGVRGDRGPLVAADRRADAVINEAVPEIGGGRRAGDHQQTGHILDERQFFHGNPFRPSRGESIFSVRTSFQFPLSTASPSLNHLLMPATSHCDFFTDMRCWEAT